MEVCPIVILPVPTLRIMPPPVTTSTIARSSFCTDTTGTELATRLWITGVLS